MLNPQKQCIIRIVVDIGILAALLAIGIHFKRFRRATTQRGFFCDDATLKYPYREDTISPRLLYALGLYTPLAIILLNETHKYLRLWKLAGGDGNTTTLSQHAAKLCPLYGVLRQFLFGFAAERLIKNVGKQTLGRLRPYFFAVCQPQFEDGSTCADAHNHGIYLEAYTCRGNNTFSMHVSFPSGHASFAFYGMTFVVLYLARQRLGAAAALLRQLLQLLCALCAWFVALSRVVDYKHHWSDVLAGAVLGGSIAAVVVLFWWRPDDSGVATVQDLGIRKTSTTPQQQNAEAVVKSLDLCDVKVMPDE